jgi:hypothetical protein
MKARVIDSGAKKNKETSTMVIHSAFEEPTEIEKVDVREAAPTIARIDVADKMNPTVTPTVIPVRQSWLP